MTSIIDEDLAGFQIGKYQFKKKIGAGSSSTIWLAMSGDESFAIKYTNPNHNHYKKIKQSLTSECDVFKKLKHPGLVKSYEVMENRKGVFYVMEYFESTNLFHAVKHQQTFIVKKNIDIIKQMINVLSFVHKMGYIHCDIKPDNFLLSSTGMVKLVDFQLFQKISVFNKLKTLVTTKKDGTPEYMSPEQIKGQTLNFSSDTYSLGLVIYYLLTGETTFERPQVQEVLHSQINEEAPRPATRKKFIGNYIQSDIIMKMIAKKPQNRLSNLDEILYMMNKSSQ